MNDRRIIWTVNRLALLAISSILVPQSISAQNAKPVYDQLPVKAEWDVRGKDKNERTAIVNLVRDRASAVGEVIAGRRSLDSFQSEFDELFNQYMFPRWTWSELIDDPKQFNFLAIERKRLFANYVRKAEATSVHPHLVDLTFNKMTEIARGNFHPASRFNAMLVIADLNSQDSASFSSKSNEIALAKALPLMISEFNDPKQIDVVRVACLLGILRHAQLDANSPEGRRAIGNDLRTQITQMALGVVNSTDRPAGRSVDGQAWLQRRSLEILSNLGTLESDVTVASRIETMISDGSMPLTLRYAAAESLAQLNNPTNTPLTPTGTTRKLGELASVGLQHEISRIKAEIKYLEMKDAWLSGGSPGGGRQGAAGPGGAAPGMAGMGAGAGAGAGASMDGEGAKGGAAGGKSGMPGGKGGMSGMPGGRGKSAKGSKGGLGAMATAKAASPHDEFRLELAKRRLKSYMQSVLLGLEGPKDNKKPKTIDDGADSADASDVTASAPATAKAALGIKSLAKSDADREFVTRVALKVEEIRDMMDDQKIDELDKLIADVDAKNKELEALYGIAKKDAATAGEKAASEPADDGEL